MRTELGENTHGPPELIIYISTAGTPAEFAVVCAFKGSIAGQSSSPVLTLCVEHIEGSTNIFADLLMP